MSATISTGLRSEIFGPKREPGPGAPENSGHATAAATPALGDGERSSAARVQPASEAEKSKNPNEEDLSEDEQAKVDDLKRRDAEVRAHEQAHAAAGGPYAGAPSFEFTTGPDGKRYATSGEVSIDTSPIRGNPAATIRKMDVVIRAALSPSEPSSQDQQVARQAQKQRTEAQAELREQRQAEPDGKGGNDKEAPSADGEGTSSRTPLDVLLQANAAYGNGNKEDDLEFSKQDFSKANEISIFA